MYVDIALQGASLGASEWQTLNVLVQRQRQREMWRYHMNVEFHLCMSLRRSISTFKNRKEVNQTPHISVFFEMKIQTWMFANRMHQLTWKAMKILSVKPVLKHTKIAEISFSLSTVNHDCEGFYYFDFISSKLFIKNERKSTLVKTFGL